MCVRKLGIFLLVLPVITMALVVLSPRTLFRGHVNSSPCFLIVSHTWILQGFANFKFETAAISCEHSYTFQGLMQQQGILLRSESGYYGRCWSWLFGQNHWNEHSGLSEARCWNANLQISEMCERNDEGLSIWNVWDLHQSRGMYCQEKLCKDFEP